jgi:hypothetical protein
MADFTNTGTFISASTAKANLGKYFKDEGKAQLSQDHPDHVFGHVFGLAKVKDLVAKIDQHNLSEPDVNKHIKGLRIYHSKTKTKNDVMIVPVTKDGKDHPDQIHGGTAPKTRTKAKPMILSDASPCPNVCPH